MADNRKNSQGSWRPVEHSMKRRKPDQDYRSAGTAYMLTLVVEEQLPLLGTLVGQGLTADMALSPLGEAMREAWLALPSRFPEVCTRDRIDEFVIMPNHFHGVIYVMQSMETHLSRIESYLKGRVHACYRRLLLQGGAPPVGQAREWLAMYNQQPPEMQLAMQQWVERSIAAYSSCGPEPQRADEPPYKVRQSGSHSKVGFLFEIGYNDAIVWSIDMLENKHRYIAANPRTLALRREHRLFPERGVLETALSVPALYGYLRQVCPAHCATDELLGAIGDLLLTQQQAAATSRCKPMVVCDIYGSRGMLQKPRLPLVCHRADRPLLGMQRKRCLEAAAAGTVIVSPCISPSEREIFKAVLEAGHRAMLIYDNGFTDKYHPTERDLMLCMEERLLIVTPWKYHYVPKSDKIKTAYCKTMNCVAQSLCRMADNWWKYAETAK